MPGFVSLFRKYESIKNYFEREQHMMCTSKNETGIHKEETNTKSARDHLACIPLWKASPSSEPSPPGC